jgi:segregation and condensation protein B
MEDLEKLIEAALFMTTKPLTIHDLMKATNSDWNSIKAAIANLQNEYVQRGSWIEVVGSGKTYLMRLKPQYADKIAPFTQEIELSKRALKVLSIVANNDGIVQSKIAKSIGPSTYGGVKELIDKGFLNAERRGHSKILKLSQKFRTYFGELAVGKISRVETGEETQAVQAQAPPEQAPQNTGPEQPQV